VAAVFGSGSEPPPFDLHCPLLSLAERFGTSLATIPAEIPYLVPEPAAVERWRDALGDGPGLRIGLVWAGNPGHRNDRNRSIAVERLQPLFQVPGIRWFSLQVGPRAGDVARLPLGLVADLSASLSDFAETAAVIANLDLVLAIDTAVVHVAGALGRPVWAMLSFAPDWRWLLDRDDSPWYPSLRIFRQPIPGDWATVVGNVRRALADLAAQTRPNRQLAARPRPKEEPPAVPALDAQLAYDAAMGHYAAGRIDMTGAAAKEILASHPDHAAAQHLVGLVEINHGRRSGAASCRPGHGFVGEPHRSGGNRGGHRQPRWSTAIVPLAGALGRPCWMKLPFAPDWRWLLERTDSPWYPTLRLFRQPARGDWDKVIAEVREALAGLIGDTSSFDAGDAGSAFAGATADYSAGRLV
jgi:hypothetical protein